jgi:hypothetical protein
VFLGLAIMSFAIGGGWHAAQAQTNPGFGSFSLTATAPGFEMTEDEPSANAHPEGGGTVPYATVVLSNGPLGYALSSVAWPGATEANAGALVGLLFPTSAGGVPIPDAVTGAVGDNAHLANYPVRAEARTGSTPDASFDTFPGASLTAHADPALVQANGSVNGATQPGSASIGNATSQTTAALTDTTGTAEATSKVSNIDIGGVIKIDSVTSTATGATDAVTGTSSGSTIVQGMTIANQPAYVDDSGVHIGNQGQPANAIASQIANKALSQGGFQFFVAQPQTEQSGAAASYTAGSLFVVWTPPQNPSANVFVIALGGARVAVAAAPGFGLPALPITTPSLPTVPSVGAPASPARPATPAVPAATTPAAAVATTPRSSFAPKKATFTFDGIAVPFIVLGLLGAGIMAAGTRRVADDVVDRIPSTCPLETT